MFLGMEWYWWLIIVVVAALSIPFKIKFMNWWSKRKQKQNDNHRDQWGGEK